MDGWSIKPIGWNNLTNINDNDLINTNLNDYQQDYVMILAGGLDHHGHCHPWYRDRLDIALKLNNIKRRKYIILGGGTYHKPPILNLNNYVLHESTVGAKYLVDNGISPNNIYREWSSYDTIANGYFSLINFTIPLNLKDILIITSDFHMPRSKQIFNWIYSLYFSTNQPILTFLEVNSKYLDDEIINVRKLRENNSLNSVILLQNHITTFTDFIDWFYHKHKAYNCDFNHTENIDHITKQSY